MYLQERDNVLALLDTIGEAVDYASKHKDEATQYMAQAREGFSAVQGFLTAKAPELDPGLAEAVSGAFSGAPSPASARGVLGGLSRLKKAMRTGLRIKLRAVFLPYKASMWTALESIWRAADADPDCEATVVPIPYYDLDNNGHKVKYNYEGDQYPKDVPVVHYSQYPIDQIKPDMIFIHNPYDDMNNLTRVPEGYYSRNLKRHTRMLVYSPYYTIVAYAEKEGCPLCELPATSYADRIVVQSERVAELYKRYGHASSKLLILGSPKMDAVMRAQHTPIEMPDKWKDRLDGRCVFLLATTLGFLGYNPKGLFRITAASDLILKNPDCALIWRPHPLERNLIENRIPELLPVYDDFYKTVNHSTNGVIDDNASYDYSFVFSRAMFGPGTSLSAEYMATGKPVYLFYSARVERPDRKYLVDYRLNYLFEHFDNFIEMVVNGEDPMYGRRMQMMYKAYNNLEDASCGTKTYDTIKREILGAKTLR